MEKDYQKLYQTLRVPTIPQGLRDSVLARIDIEARHASLVGIAMFTPLVFISAFSVIVSFQYLAGEAAQSGLSNYLSIIFSDWSTLISYWKEFLISLAEQVPVFETIIFLGTVLALLGSLKSMLKNIRTRFGFMQLIN